MLKLYDYLPSQNGFKIRLLLQHLGQPYQHVPVAIFQGESRTPEFLEKNPVGAIPVLEPEPGVHIAESNAILCYLAEGTAYLPAERLARARVMQWLFFEQYYVEPTIGTLRFWVLTNKVKANEALAAAKRGAGERALDALERHLSQHSFLACGSGSPTSMSTIRTGSKVQAPTHWRSPPRVKHCLVILWFATRAPHSSISGKIRLTSTLA